MKTALTNELPVVQMLSDSPALRAVVADRLEQFGFSISTSTSGSEYKNVLIFSGSGQEGLVVEQLRQVANSAAPTIIVLPIVDQVVTSKLGLWQAVSSTSQQLLQTVVAEAPTAKLVLVNGWIHGALGVVYSLPSLCVADISKLVIQVPSGLVYPVGTESVTKLLGEFVSQPHSGRSVVVRGTAVSSPQFANSVTELYESYHRVAVEVVLDGQIAPNTPPFSLQEVAIPSDPQALARELARALPGPGKPLTYSMFGQSAVVRSQRESQPNRSVSIQQEVLADQPAVDHEQQSDQVLSQLETLFVDKRVSTKSERVQNLAAQEQKGKKKNHRRQLFFWMGALSAGVAMAVLALVGVYWLSTNALKSTFSHQLQTLSQDGVGEFVASNQLTGGTRLARFVEWQLEMFGQLVDNPELSKIQEVLRAREQLLAIIASASKQIELQDKILSHLSGTETVNLDQALTDLSALSNRNLTELSEFATSLNALSQSGGGWQEALEQINGAVEGNKKQLAYLSQLLPVVSDILGVREARTYALLFLDSAELRPTGGFVQAVAILTVADGRITTSRVLSSYEIDEKLGGLVEPPAELAAILGEDAWYFRDSNWDADHAVVAERVAWFLEKSLGISLDGVISIPSVSFAELLEPTSSLSVPEFNETITPGNLGERLLFYNEANATSSSQSFAVALLRAYLSNISNQTPTELASTIAALVDQLDQANIQISLFQPAERESFELLRWTGSHIQPTCPPQFSKVDCAVDYVHQVESNVGINKTNPFVTRNTQHSVLLQDGVATHQRSTTLTNTARSNAWPQGTYKSLITWFVPENSQLVSLTINGVAVSPDQLLSKQDGGYVSYAVVVETPIQSQREISLVYRAPIDTTLPHSYMLFDQKQPGISSASHRITIARGDMGQAARVAPQPSAVEPQLTFEFERDAHSLVLVEYN